MTATETPGTRVEGEAHSGAGSHWFDEAMRLPGATLDNVSDGSTGYDGPRCIECYAAIGDTDEQYCPYCPEPTADAGGDR